MKKLSFLLAAVIMLSISAFAQPDTLWTKRLGGFKGHDVQLTSDNGYFIVGEYGNVYIIKTDENGNEIWSHSFGGSNECQGFSGMQTIDGGYIIAGSMYIPSSENCVVYLIKTDGNGNESWSQTFGTNGYDEGRSVQQTLDGGYIITGVISYFDVYLIKTDANGNELWSQSFGGGGMSTDIGYSVQQTSDGGYIIAGYTESFGAGGYDVYLIKTDGSGNESWSQTFGGTGDDRGYSVQQTADEGYIIAGYTTSYGVGTENIYLIKTDASGNELWTQFFEYSEPIIGRDVQQTMDGGFIIAGYIKISGVGYRGVYVLKTDDYGNEIWSQTVSEDISSSGKSVKQTSDGGYIVVGDQDLGFPIGRDIYLIRLDSELGIVEDLGNNQPSSFILHQPSPNPFNPSTELSYSIRSSGEVVLAIFDITGCEVSSLFCGYQSAGSHHITWNAQSFSSGVYFARLTSASGKVQTQKLVLMK